ncbi:hypothetical protein, partial [Mangrovicoccus algicola]
APSALPAAGLALRRRVAGAAAPAAAGFVRAAGTLAGASGSAALTGAAGAASGLADAAGALAVSAGFAGAALAAAGRGGAGFAAARLRGAGAALGVGSDAAGDTARSLGFSSSAPDGAPADVAADVAAAGAAAAAPVPRAAWRVAASPISKALQAVIIRMAISICASAVRNHSSIPLRHISIGISKLFCISPQTPGLVVLPEHILTIISRGPPSRPG